MEAFSTLLAPYAWLWWTMAFLYNPAVLALQQCAPHVVPWRGWLRRAWGLWNAGFALFSAVGFLATYRVYLAMLGSFTSLCFADSPAAASFWAEHYSKPAVHSGVLLFIVSKLFELGDTLFLAALGKPIIFLHWYHHLTILVYMYVGGLQWHPYMISGVVWNYCVHAVMYAYYASSCFGLRWPKFLARNITTLQLTQMAANLVLLVATCACCGSNNHISFWPTAAMYAVYAALFLELYKERYKTKTTSASTDAARAKRVPHEGPLAAWQSFVTIEGYDYDITAFAQHHPGGGVIKHWAGLDASAAFTEFHRCGRPCINTRVFDVQSHYSNSKKANLVLQTLPKRPTSAHKEHAGDEYSSTQPLADGTLPTSAQDKLATSSSSNATPTSSQGSVCESPDADDTATSGLERAHPVGNISSPSHLQDDAAIMADFKEWRASLVARGLFKPRPAWQLVWFLAEPLAIMALGCWLMKATGSLLCGVLLMALANVRCGWIQHEGGHNSLTTNPKVDKLIQSLSIGFGLSMSGWVWNSMHNKHHATPNKINSDIDLNTLPLVAFYMGCIEKDNRSRGGNTPLLLRWLRGQAYTFLPVTTMAVSMLWFYFLHPIKAWRKDRLGLLVMAASHVIKPALFVVFAGTTFLQGYLLMTAAYWFTSAYMFGHFSLSHTFMPVVEEGEHPSWVRFALEHSVDISPGNFVVDWVMGYLNYQVIHHLFPSMPQCYGPLVSPELRAKAKEWGITYTTVPYWGAWTAMLANLDAVGKHYSTSGIDPTRQKTA